MSKCVRYFANVDFRFHWAIHVWFFLFFYTFYTNVRLSVQHRARKSNWEQQDKLRKEKNIDFKSNLSDSRLNLSDFRETNSMKTKKKSSKIKKICIISQLG